MAQLKPVIQILVCDSRDYIMAYKDFIPKDIDGIKEYVETALRMRDAHHLRITKHHFIPE